MGAAMMAPDYAWWHGFYECKKRYSNYMEKARDLIQHNKKAYVAKDFPNGTGSRFQDGAFSIQPNLLSFIIFS